MVEQLVEFFRGIPDWISLIAISVLPIIELRGGIIAAKLMGVAFLRAYTFCATFTR